MIRVLLRDVNDADAQIVGDFAPDQIDTLEALLLATEVYNGEDDPTTPPAVVRQWICATPPATPRWCLELILMGPEG
jgi:hypothetical protein